MFTFAEYLLNSTEEFNGHKQTTLGHMEFNELKNVVSDLSKIDPNNIYSLEIIYKNFEGKDGASIYKLLENKEDREYLKTEVKDRQLILCIEKISY